MSVCAVWVRIEKSKCVCVWSVWVKTSECVLDVRDNECFVRVMGELLGEKEMYDVCVLCVDSKWVEREMCVCVCVCVCVCWEYF
jgi:hypothetical protein